MADKLSQELRALYESLRRERRAEFARTTSFGDHFTDRWERARFEKFGEGTSIYDNVLILGNVAVGKNCWIGPNVILDGTGGLVIGDHVDVSAGCQIYSHHTVRRCLSGGRDPIDKKSTIIGSNVYIGPNCVVQMGVSIGDNVIIGAMSLVTRDIGAGTAVWGTPARIVGNSRDHLQMAAD